ncbi:hydroxysteroid 11-beta-dehydrogenase 1-like protein isoform X2 [Ptychodera flava]|uniref:hydroxysteroid 11-beta-dehydrogenase 1-like protein isoform X2 n=1 Tax=Ptychodera flava TaxID=63121 RepID=UPI00396A5747
MGRFRKITGAIVLVCAIYIAYIMRDTFDPESIRGKKVIVTGASTGIGEQIAYHYARLGAKILITARRENLLKEVSKKCIELGAQEAHYLPMDMAKVNDTGRLIVEAEKKLGGLDYLVLNHALYYWELWDGNIEKLQNIMNVNFMSFVSLASKALPMLTKTNGSIVVVSSAAGMVGIPAITSYCATKHALGGFFEALRQELVWKKTDVAITYFIPGVIGTEHGLSVAQGQLKTPEFIVDQVASPDLTALALVKSAAARESIAYYPWLHSRPFEILHTLSHEFSNWILSKIAHFYLSHLEENQ